ncbi:MAG: DUF126 domain-containing protein [Nitrosopumilaceae archaeon]|nr:DUF126 domain-containing protein [Nitrosopumilaceae archaeon]
MKVLVEGRAQGTVLKSEMPINFLGAVDKKTGVITDRNHDLYGKSVKGVILVFPSGAGSSVGAYTIYALKSGGAAPAGMICRKADLTVATGCAVAGIPLHILDPDKFASIKTGQQLLLGAD